MIPSCVRNGPAIWPRWLARPRKLLTTPRGPRTASGLTKQEGFSAALLRQVPVMTDLIEELERNCPPFFAHPGCRFAGLPAPDYER